MGTKAYFMIKMAQKFNEDGYYEGALRELEAMPEVETVKPVSGLYDLVVKVDASVRLVSVANKIMAKKWVENLHVLAVEPAESAQAPKSVAQEVLEA